MRLGHRWLIFKLFISNRLKFNADESEFIWLGTRQQLRKVTLQFLDVSGVSVAPVSKVRDLGVINDEELTIAAHVNHVVSGYFSYEVSGVPCSSMPGENLRLRSSQVG